MSEFVVNNWQYGAAIVVLVGGYYVYNNAFNIGDKLINLYVDIKHDFNLAGGYKPRKVNPLDFAEVIHNDQVFYHIGRFILSCEEQKSLVTTEWLDGELSNFNFVKSNIPLTKNQITQLLNYLPRLTGLDSAILPSLHTVNCFLSEPLPEGTQITVENTDLFDEIVIQ